MGKKEELTVDGLVIKEVDTGESDRIITLLTAERGKISAICKGARSLKSQRMSADRKSVV